MQSYWFHNNEYADKNRLQCNGNEGLQTMYGIRNDKKKQQQPSNIEIGVFRSLKDRSC